MNTDNEARELLKELRCNVNAERPYVESTLNKIDAYLARTEPQHPAKVAFAEWWASSPSPELASSKLDCQRAALAFYRKGMEAAAGIAIDKWLRQGFPGGGISDTDDLHRETQAMIHKAILNAAKETPE